MGAQINRLVRGIKIHYNTIPRIVIKDLENARHAVTYTFLNRITARDGIDEEAARLRIGAQLTDGFFRENCDFIIENNDDKNSLFKKTETIFNRI